MGFLYQFDVALLLLLEKPNSEVSVESLDDVVFEENNNTSEIMQLKHHINSKGSLIDSSQDLWKTLNIWIDGLDVLDESTIRTLMTTEKASDNTIAYFLGVNESKRDQQKALEILNQISENNKNKKNIPIYQKFKTLSNEQKKKLVESIFIITSAPNINEVKQKLVEKFRINARPENLHTFVDRIKGQWINMVSSRLASNSKSTISYNEINSHIQNIRDQFTQDNLPIDFLDRSPNKTQIKSYQQMTFVKQLELLSVTNKITEYAIIDYWKAYQQRDRWIKDELLYDSDLIKYENRIVDAWKKEFAKKEHELGTAPTENAKQKKGWELYNWADNKSDICIRDRCTEPYVIQGSFHMLANELKVGWHVDFLTRLKHLLKTAEETA